MQRKKRSPIWKCSREELQAIVDNSMTYSQILGCFGLRNIGSNHLTLKKRLDEENIDYVKIKENKGKYGKNFHPPLPLEAVMIENSTYSRCALKSRLIKNGMLIEECAECKMSPIWNGKKLILVLDHINGVSNDNRLENLRLLCPNCNSQTDTFAGKSNRVKIEPNKSINSKIKKEKVNVNRTKKIHLCECGNEITKAKLRCRLCFNKSRRVVERPSKDELEKMIWEIPTQEIGKMFGVSDNAVGKWCKSYNIEKPPRGYWQKKKYNKLD